MMKEISFVAVLVALGGCGDDTTTAPEGRACFTLADGSCVEETFANPPRLEPDADGVLQLELRPTEFTFAGQRHCGRGYNGLYPAPTIETPAARAGEERQVRVNLRNRFTRSDFQPVNSEEEDVCTCVDTETGASCDPGGHAGHGGAASSCACTNTEGDACHYFDFNVTNLHFHGSHVRPDYAAGGGCVEQDGLRCRACSGDRDDGARECFHSDDVLSRVGPGDGVQHRYDLDEDGVHHGGLSWYHPHIHGSTAIQVAGGAAGAWIVRGPVDEMPGIANARERVMVLTTPPTNYEPLAEGEPCDEDHITFQEFWKLAATPGVSAQGNLVNGISKPRLIMAPGQIERWRIVDASFLDEVQIAVFRGKDAECAELDLAAGPIPLTQIGRDGLTLPRPADGKDWPYAPPYIFMSSGYRVDALLDGNQLAHGDTLCVMAGRALQEDTTGTTSEAVGTLTVPTPQGILDAIVNGEVMAIVNVTDDAGPPTETQMPDLAAVAADAPSMMLQGGQVDALARCEEVAAIDDVDEIDQLTAFWMLPTQGTAGFDQCSIKDHNVNGRNFELTDRERRPYDRVLEVGAVDHWRVLAGFDGHPFHIHINPFLVCPLPPEGSPEPNTKGRLFEPPFAHWRDTYLVNLDRTLDAITEYRAFTGDYVFHCHKLTHEDHGMMELLRVCDPAIEACDTLCDGGPCAWDVCPPGDDDCARELAATKCLVDPADHCAEAALRCTPCGEEQSCPPEAICSDVPSQDGQTRCIPEP